MKEIRPYIHTNAAVSIQDRARVSYLLRFTKDGEELTTRTDRLMTVGNQKSATLEAMITALSRIKDGNEIPILVVCHCPGIIQAINQGLYERWRSNGWTNSKGTAIEHASKWESVVELIEHKTKGGIKAAAPTDQEALIMQRLGAEEFDPHANIA